jgi:hypothetical protein
MFSTEEIFFEYFKPKVGSKLLIWNLWISRVDYIAKAHDTASDLEEWTVYG